MYDSYFVKKNLSKEDGWIRLVKCLSKDGQNTEKLKY